MSRLSNNGFAKYSCQEKKFSLDGGRTWNSYEPKVYRMGNLIEMFSTDCDYQYTDASYTVVHYWNLTANRYIYRNGEMDGSHTAKNGNVMKIEIGETVVAIGDYAMNACAATSITISSSVKYIGDGAIQDCEELLELKYNGTVAQWNNIGKGEDWSKNCWNVDYVQCLDGNVPIDPN